MENLIKEFPGGYYTVIKSTPIFPGDIPLVEIGYKYNYWKYLGYIVTKGAVSTYPGDPYLYCFLGNYSNVSILHIICTRVLGRYFDACNSIYNHNRMCKSDLALKKYWVR